MPFTSLNKLCWNASAKPFCRAKWPCFDFSSSNFNSQRCILSTAGAARSNEKSTSHWSDGEHTIWVISYNSMKRISFFQINAIPVHKVLIHFEHFSHSNVLLKEKHFHSYVWHIYLLQMVIGNLFEKLKGMYNNDYSFCQKQL